MRMMMTAAAVAALMAVGACSEGAGGGGDSAKVTREPGKWKTDIKLVSLEAPGLNDQMKDGMKQMMEGASGVETCVTAEQIAKEDIATALSEADGKKCTFTKKEVAGSKIDVAGTCEGNTGEKVTLAMTGTQEAKKTDVLMDVSSPLPTGAGEMKMKMQMTAVHVGPC